MPDTATTHAKQGMFRSLRNRNYRLYFTGQAISLIGTWMQQVALGWLIYRLTNSAALLGLVAFAGQIPSLLFSPFAGTLADRMDRHKLYVWTQVLAMGEALALAALTLSGHAHISGIIILGAIAGLINAVAMPTQQALLVELIEQPEDLTNAIGLNSSLMNATRLVGPAIAGVLVAWVGEGMCFLLNGLSYIGVLIALLQMHVTPRPKAAHSAPMLAHMREGIRYAMGFSPIRAIILFIGTISLAGMSYMVLMPVFAKTILHGDAQTLGWLTGSSGVGALAGALLLANRQQIMGIGRWITGASVLFSLGLIAFSLSQSIWLSMGILAATGFGMMIMFGSCNMVMQTLVDEDKRGRVMSLFTMAFMGMMPFGSLLTGWLGDVIGVPHTLQIGGVICLLTTAWFVWQIPTMRVAARPVLVQKGFIDEVPTPIG